MRKNYDELQNEQLPKIATDKSSDDPAEFQSPEAEASNSFWRKIKWLHERGLHKGDYQEYNAPSWNLTKGSHYYVIEDAGKRSIKCISCSIKHGGILEARLLTRYRLNEGVLYLDDKPLNATPENFDPGA